VSAQHIDNLRLLSSQTPDSFQNWQESLTRSRTVPDTALDLSECFRSEAMLRANDVDQSGLTDACFSGHKYDLTFSAKHLLEASFSIRDRPSSRPTTL
jgi:hypothetical protein